MKFLTLLFFASTFITAAVTSGQEKNALQMVQLNDHLYKLSYNVGYVVNMVASVGDDGILLVDTGEKVRAADLKKVIDQFNRGNPKIIINTHAHVDHTGGNAIFGNESLIIGHSILKTRLRSGSYLFDEYPEAALPDITFSDSLTLYFNGEEIRLLAFPGAHDDNDIIVWFTGSRIVAAGDLIYTNGFPSYEEVTGSVLGYRDVVPKILAAIPDDVTIVTGHTENGNIETSRIFHAGIVESAAAVKAEMDKGLDFEAIQKSGALDRWANFSDGYVSLDEWLQELMDAFQTETPRLTLYEPIYYALKDGGVDQAIARYRDLRENHYDEYRFVDNDMLFMADKLSRNGRLEESIALWKLCIDEFPRSLYIWYCHYNLGKLYASTGQKDIALEYYRKSLELNPENSYAVEKIRELEDE